MKVLDLKRDSEGFNVLIQDGKIEVWLDVCGENLDNFDVDWNMYIFDTLNENDMLIKSYQENCENFDKCYSMAIQAVKNYNSKPI